jgi:hypothetical protein
LSTLLATAAAGAQPVDVPHTGFVGPRSGDATDEPLRSAEAGCCAPDSAPEPRNEPAPTSPRPNRLEAHGGVEVGLDSAERAGVRVGAAFTRTFDSFELAFDVSYLRGIAGTTGLTGELNAGCAVAGAGPRLMFGRAALSARAGIEARYAWAALTRVDSARLKAAAISPSQWLSWPSAGPRLAVAAVVALGSEVVATAELAGALLVSDELQPSGETRLGARPQLTLNLGVGHAF